MWVNYGYSITGLAYQNRGGMLRVESGSRHLLIASVRDSDITVHSAFEKAVLLTDFFQFFHRNDWCFAAGISTS